jgi:fused signal recognition particle receptor
VNEAEILTLVIAVAVAAAGVSSIVALARLRVRRRRSDKGLEAPPPAESVVPREAPPQEAGSPETGAPPVLVPTVTSNADALVLGMRKSRRAFWDGLGAWFRGGASVGPAEWDALEERLLVGDVGTATTEELLRRTRERLKAEKERAPRDILVEEGSALFERLPAWRERWEEWPRPYVVSLVGINGAGKTTTVGKIAARFTASGKKVLLGATDTFRSAAQEQLKVWAKRSGAEIVTGRPGGDPGAVAFDAVTAGKARGADVVLLDTAGRLHSKEPLMDELKKVHRVVGKVIPDAPHERWLVVDGTLGQNSLAQARAFREALQLTGLVVTKLDGTAKGGAVLAIARELELPVCFIGVGEQASDLIPFEPRRFVEALLGDPSS